MNGTGPTGADVTAWAVAACSAAMVPGLPAGDAALAARGVLANRSPDELLRVAGCLAVLASMEIPRRVRRGQSVRTVLDGYSIAASWGE